MSSLSVISYFQIHWFKCFPIKRHFYLPFLCFISVSLLYILAVLRVKCSASSGLASSTSENLQHLELSSEPNTKAGQDPIDVTLSNQNSDNSRNKRQTNSLQKNNRSTLKQSTSSSILELGEMSSSTLDGIATSTFGPSWTPNTTECSIVTRNSSLKVISPSTNLPSWNYEEDDSAVSSKTEVSSTTLPYTTLSHAINREGSSTFSHIQTQKNAPSFKPTKRTAEATTDKMNFVTEQHYMSTVSGFEEGHGDNISSPNSVGNDKNENLPSNDHVVVHNDKSTTPAAEKSTTPSFLFRPEIVYKQERENFNLSHNITGPYCDGSSCNGVDNGTDNCYCDDLCFFYSDCCYNKIEKLYKLTAETVNETKSFYELVKSKATEVGNTSLMLSKELISCVGDVTNGSAFIMVSGCNGTVHNSQKYVEKCISSEKSYSSSNLPVDQVVNKTVIATFKNIYCAFCNDIPQNQLFFWKINLLCNTTDIGPLLNMEVHEIEALKVCELKPQSLFHTKLRRCSDGILSSEFCSTNSTSKIADLCRSYIYPLISEDNTSVVYRNPHCAACSNSNLNVTHLNCFTKSEEKYKPENIVKPVNLQVFFDFSADNSIVSKVKCGQDIDCKSYEIYDCISKRCTQLYCPAGETPQDGHCIKILDSLNGVITDVNKPLDMSDNGMEFNRNNAFIIELLEGNDIEIVVYALGTTTERILDHINTLLYRSRKHLTIIDMPTDCDCIMFKEAGGGMNVITDLFPQIVNYFEELEDIYKLRYSLIPPYIRVRNFKTLTSLECALGDLLIETNSSIVETNASLAFALYSPGIMVLEQNCGWQLQYNKYSGVFSDLIATCLVRNLNGPKLNCSMVAYGLDEVIIANSSVTIIYANFTVYDDFTVFQNRVFICADSVTDIEYFVNIFQYTANHRLLSILTSSVSVVSAAVLLTVHCRSKRLRNIHGLNLSALSVSILFIHVLLIVQTYSFTSTVCTIYAVVLHFVLLNSFVWMNIIGYDMTRTFVSDSVVLHSSLFRRFLAYVVISVALPTLIIVVAIILEFTDSSFKPEYGEREVCWLSNGKGILVFVIGPVLLSLFLSFCFFAFTMIAIIKKIQQTNFARKTTNRSYFVVYLKLTIILGLTWILGIVGAFVKQEWTWIVHLVLNGLQGLSLLICSVVNARSVRQLKSSLHFSTSNTNGTASDGHVNANTNV